MVNRNIKDFKLNQVKVTDAYFVNSLEKEISYLKSFNSDKLVAGFREVNNMRPKAEKYPGWEVTEIRGHSLGHYMTAVAQAVAQTGDSELKEKLQYIVDELCKSQLKSGYLSAFPETLFDNVENKKPAWVPWYTMDKIISGLTVSYTLAGIENALDVVKKLGDWVYSRTSTWSKEIQDTVLAVEYGGMNEAMYDLYKVTKDENHAKAAHMFDEMFLFEQLEAGNDILNGKHANTTIPKFLGALYRYISLGYNKEDEFYFRAAKKFWEIVDENHTYITGGNSEWEHFGESRILDAERTNCNCETCNTYNMLKLSRELFKITGDVKFADFYENTLMNAIMSSQDPETGMTMYFQPMATGFFKVYSTPYDSFWCCTGTGMENFTKCNDSMYFHDDNTIYVNQFVSSSVNWEEKGFVLNQKSEIPESDNTILSIEEVKEPVMLAIRIPDWAAGEVKIIITSNGEKKEYITSKDLADNGYYNVEIKDKSVINVHVPMTIKAYALPDNENCIGLKYGPVVLSAALGTEDMEESKTGVDVTIATCNTPIKDFITVNGKDKKDSTEEDVKNWIDNIEENVVKVDGKVEFHLKGTDRDNLVFSTHYKQHKERYGIYWNMVAKDSELLQSHIKNAKEKARLERVEIDSVPLGNDQYELLHNVKGENTGAGTFNGLMLRHAWSEEGWFSYEMKVKPEINNYLRAKYFSGNVGRTFNIYVDDELLVEETVQDKVPGEFYDEYYKIPESMISGKDNVTIKFAVRGDSWVGGVFDKLSIVSDYDSSSHIKSLTFSGAELDKIFDESITEYSLTVQSEDDKVILNLVLENNNNLIYVDDVLIDDSVERSIDTKDISKIVIKSIAEDFKSEMNYTFSIMK